MSQGVKQPIGQKRLTNVATVRYRKHGKRFEVACYKNKVLNWRHGIEKDLDEVLQTTTVFSNVSKGVLAKQEDLQAVFGTRDEEKICLQILREGDLQVSDKERKVEYDTLFRDVASVLVEKCVNPETNRPYTISMLERALKDAHLSVDPKRSAKQQALEALPELQKTLKIQRARMRLKLQVPAAAEIEMAQLLQKENAVVESQDTSHSQVTVVCTVEPGCFREVHSFVQQVAGGAGRVEVVSLAATDDSLTAASFDSEMLSARAAESRQAAASGPTAAASGATSASGFVAAPAAGTTRRAGPGAAGADAGEVMYRGPIQGLPEEHASRRERFAELDGLEARWEVELRSRKDGGTVDACFFSPAGEKVGAFANARRAALQSYKTSNPS